MVKEWWEGEVLLFMVRKVDVDREWLVLEEGVEVWREML